MSEWQDIRTAPKDGSHFLGFNADEIYIYSHIKETWMSKYAEGSIGYAKWLNGDVLRNSGWEYIEREGFHKWSPTHWMPLPDAPEAI